jgi:glycosyltransferase involved in cell wall biosynthesis
MKILSLIAYYLPGARAGGPIRTMANMVARLGDEIDFRIVTNNHDLGDLQPYASVPSNVWTKNGKAHVLYLSRSRGRWGTLANAIAAAKPDILYLNSFFDPFYSLLPLVRSRFRLLPPTRVVIAARGCFSPSALSIKNAKKTTFLCLARHLNLFRDVLWQASSAMEARDIQLSLGPSARVVIAPDLLEVQPIVDPARRMPKLPNSLRLIYLARLARIKNLHLAIKMLHGLSAPVQLDIWGPIEDAVYWRQCQHAIAQLPANAVVRYRGLLSKERIADTMSEYDALLLPTQSENFGHAIAEAFSAACPVLVSDRTPWRGLRELGVGWDLPLRSISSFQQVLTALAAMDESAHAVLRRRAAAFGRQIMLDPAPLEANRELFREALSRARSFSSATRLAA